MPTSSPLDAEKFRNDLNLVHLGSKILVFDEIGSTNDMARKYLDEGAPEGLVLMAESQTSGRGRMGRSWVSPQGTGIYLSVLLKPKIKPQHISQLTLMAGLSTILAVNEFSSQKAQLKWPNDILLNGRKLSGILSEYHPARNGESAVIIGIGVNVNHSQSDFPEDLGPIATSLKIETGNPVDRQILATALIRHLDRDYDVFLRDGNPAIIQKWMENSDMFGKFVSVTRGEKVIQGTAQALDAEGRLVVLLKSGGKMAFDSGEVSLGSSTKCP